MAQKELTPKERSRLEKIVKLLEKGNVAIAQFLFELEDNLEIKDGELKERLEEIKKEFRDRVEELKQTVPDIKSILEQVKGKDGYTPKKGKDYFDGEPGKNYVLTDKDKREIARSIEVPVVEKVVERTEIIKEQPVITNEIKEVAVFDEKKFQEEIPKLGAIIRDALELLQGDDRLDKSAIKGLKEWMELVEKKAGERIPAAVMGRDLFKVIDISDQLNGVTTTFNIQNVWRVWAVDLDSYPYGAPRSVNDWTSTPTSITFGSSIDPATQLATGQKCLLTVIQ